MGVDQIADSDFPLRNIQNGHVRGLMVSMKRHEFDYRTGQIRATSPAECNPAETFREDAPAE